MSAQGNYGMENCGYDYCGQGMVRVRQLKHLAEVGELWLQLIEKQMLIVGLWQYVNFGLLYMKMCPNLPLLSTLLHKGHVTLNINCEVQNHPKWT